MAHELSRQAHEHSVNARKLSEELAQKAASPEAGEAPNQNAS